MGGWGAGVRSAAMWILVMKEGGPGYCFCVVFVSSS